MPNIKLVSLARLAAYTQELWHNGEASEDVADKAIKAFEIAAFEDGARAVTWPGLYPLVTFVDGREQTIS